MIIDELKYNRLFLEKFQANNVQLVSEFKRVVDEHGYTEEIKLSFYEAAFDTLIKQFKQDLPKDENYTPIITNCYEIFIKTLKEDNIDTTKLEEELDKFKVFELPNIEIPIKSTFIPENKQYNLNTKYGRRKAREQAARNYQNGNPEYRKEIDNLRFIAYVIIVIILVIIYFIKNSK